jgi:hypothetical protein
MIPWNRARIGSVVIVLLVSWAGCATEGQGTTPPLPGEPPLAGDSTGAGTGDGGAVGSGDDGGTSDEGAASADAGEGACNDFLHGLRALFVLPPVPCKGTSDCSAGDCCFVGPTSSTCVMR